jgi:hypothetical protein
MYRINQTNDKSWDVTQDNEIVANFDTLKQATDFVNQRVGYLMFRGF